MIFISQNFNYFSQRNCEESITCRLAGDELTDLRGVVDSTKDELRRAVVATADVRHVGFTFDQVFGRAEVAQLQDARVRVQKQILGLDVPVADAQRVDIRQRTK